MAARRPGDSGQLRIIGGEWRGRKLRFPAAKGLRPTPDRVRETLFNWLAAVIAGRHCLDAFAGSGALGLEALSRGASWVDFIEENPRCIDQLRGHLQTLQCERARCERQDLLRWLGNRSPGQAYDLVFLDPPYDANLHEAAAIALEQGGWLSADAWLYVESRAQNPAPALPACWQPHREKTMGDVRAAVYRRG
ncbi:MAG: 16S rRNA (guanine(966)-N(2))-methyltransferase RsmD [Halieaceae bacterium]|jgi:16S rRNA (guanine966-N2)-methyltransferase|nr:16S rRNA (guanine(966)-N(2))-methyltransferase RsmD [Halieaceae bacterium]